MEKNPKSSNEPDETLTPYDQIGQNNGKRGSEDSVKNYYFSTQYR